MVLRKLPPAEFAVWSLFSTIVSCQVLAELGFGGTFARAIAYAMGGAERLERVQLLIGLHVREEPNWELLSRILGTMRAIYLRLTILVAVLVLAGGILALWRPIDRTQAPLDGWIAWTMVAFATMASFRTNQFVSLLLGMNQVALLRRWETACALGGVATTGFVLLFSDRLAVLMGASQAWVLLNAWKVRRLALHALHDRHLVLPPAQVDSQVIAAVWPSAWRSGVGSAMSYGLVQIGGIVYAQSSNLSSINSYLLGLRLIQAINQFSQAPFYSKLPVLALLWAQGRHEELVAVARRGMAFSYWAFVAPFILLGWIGVELHHVVSSSTEFPSPSVWTLLGAAYFAERYGAMHLQLYSLSNCILWHIANGVAGVIMVLAWVLLVPVVGAAGFPLGMLVAYVAFYSWYSAAHSHKLLNLSFPQFDLATIGAPFAAALVARLWAVL